MAKRFRKAAFIIVAVGIGITSLALTDAYHQGLFIFGGLLAVALVLLPFWWRSPRYLLFGYVLYTPFEDGLLHAATKGTTIAYVLPDLLVLGASCAAFLLARLRRERLFGSPMDLPLLLLIGVSVASLLINHVPLSTGAQGIYTFLRYGALFYAAIRARFSPDDLRIFARGLIWVCLVQGIVAVAQFLLLSGTNYTLFSFGLPEGLVDGPNNLAAFMAMASVIVLAVSVYGKIRLPRFEVYALFGLTCLVTMLTISWQAIITLVIGGIIVVFLAARRHMRVIPWPALLVSVLGAAVGLVASHQGLHTLENLTRKPAVTTTIEWVRDNVPAGGIIITTNQDQVKAQENRGLQGTDSTSKSVFQGNLGAKQKKFTLQRLLSPNFYDNSRMYEIVNGGQAILQQSPIVGFGPGTFGSQHSLQDHAFYNKLHVGLLLSDPTATYVDDVGWITVLGQFGILGILGFLALILASFRVGSLVLKKSNEHSTQSLAMVLIAMVPVYFILGWINNPFSSRPISILLWFLPGLALALLEYERRASLSMPPEPVGVSAKWLVPESTLAQMIAVHGTEVLSAGNAPSEDKHGLREWERDLLHLPRICFLNGQYLPHVGGAERAMERRAASLRERGFGVFVLTYRISRKWPREEYIGSTRVVRTGGIYLRGRLLRRSGLALMPMFRGLLRERNHFDVIHAHQMQEPAFAAVVAGWLLRKPVMIEIASAGKNRGINQISHEHGLIGHVMRAVILRSKVTYIALAADSVRELRAAGIPEKRIRWIPNGVDIEKYSSHDTARSARSSQHPIRQGVCVSRLSHVKGVDVLLRAWQTVVAQVPDARLRILGDGPDRGTLEDLARSVGIDNTVEFAGDVEDVAHELAHADFFVLSSRAEGMSNAILEAMASGLPVVATAVGGTPDVITDDRDGLLVASEDVAGLAQKLLILLQYPEIGERLGKQAQERIKSAYSREKEIARLASVYEDLAPHRRRRDPFASVTDEVEPVLDLAPGVVTENTGEFAAVLRATGAYKAVGKHDRSVNRKIFRAMVSMATTTVLARILGVINQVVISSTFGAGRSMDAYFGSLEVPTVMTNIAVGGLNVAITPAYARLVHHERENEATYVLSSILNIVAFVLALVTAIMVFLPRLVIQLFAPGLPKETVDIAATLIPFVVPTLLLNTFIGFITSVLSVQGKFTLPALTTSLVPFATLLATIFAAHQFGVQALAAGLLIGTIVQLLIMIMMMRAVGVRYRPVLHMKHPEVRRVLGQLWPMLVGSAVVQLNPLIDQVVGSFFGIGSVSALNYAGKVINVPVGVIFVASSSAVLPYFSRQVAARDIVGLKNSLRLFAWLVGGVTVLVSVAFIVFSHQIVGLLYKHGNFTEQDVIITSSVLIGYSIGLFPMALEYMVPRVFSALHRNQILLPVTVFTLITNIILDVTFSYAFGLPGIALATAIDYVLTTTLLIILLRREIGALRLWKPPIDILLRKRARKEEMSKHHSR